LRVISGKARGKRLEALEGKDTRPTLDRIKESLFNIIQFDIENAVVLDLFAGSGSLGIECLSRGAKEVVFCDNSGLAIDIINTNIRNTKFEAESIVIKNDYTNALKKAANQNKKFDIIFLDPPYESDFATKALELIVELELLNENGIIIIETNEAGTNLILPEQNENIEMFATRKYGSVVLIFIKKSS